MTIKFQDFGLKADLLKGIAEIGYETPSPIQAQTIPLLLEGRDVIGCAQTGTGKTAAFSLPLLEKLEGKAENPQALILTPTRELADQIHKSIQDYSKYLPVKSVVVYGGASSRFQEHNLQKGADILVATPGRLLDFLEKRIIRLYDIKYFVLDEADRMLDMGFIPDIEEIQSYIPRQRQTLLFSATMPPEIESLARKMTQNADLIDAGTRSSTSENVTQTIYKVAKRDKFKLLLDLLEQDSKVSVIVFCSTKIGTTRLARDLIRRGVAATPIHSNLTQTQRERSLQGFRDSDYSVLVATDVAARGIDIPDVSHVINYDTPMHAEDYVHRIGRTGRASASGEAITFTTPEERKYLARIEDLIGNKLNQAEPLHDVSVEQTYSEPEPKHELMAQAKIKQTTKKQSKTPKEKAQKPEQDATTQPKEKLAKNTRAAKNARASVNIPYKPETRSEESRKAPLNIDPFSHKSESLDLPKSLLMKDAIKVNSKQKKKKWNDPLEQVPESRKPFKHPRNRQQLPTASAHAAHFFDHPDDIDYLDEHA